MQPLKVEAFLTDGRVATSDLYLPLDSMLAWSWIFEHRPELLAKTTSGLEGEIYHPPIPLKRIGDDDNWYYACSFACGKPVGERTNYWHKRFDAQHAETYADFEGRREKVNTSAGRYKNYRMPVVTYLIAKLTWYCVGDAQEIEYLLSNITHIGKKRSQGYGEIREWTVTPSDVDKSHLRPIPSDAGTDVLAIRPPYWERSNHMLVTWPEGCEELACFAERG
ncbi:hypothetical protein [Alicyclobacillus suci]|uniref:hypothetical protein n=1 Tax=Alicyclobacillus suci TaxID=2816080 RepID=UPI001A8D2A6A|nr:hypothetical protein [Alicyclobacillus suci]